MKYLLSFSFLLLLALKVFSQSESEDFKNEALSNKAVLNKDFKAEMITQDFSKLLLHTDNSVIYGFIGENYQRLRIKLITVTKDSVSPDTYHVYGKSMVKNNIDEFTGIIKISNIRKFKNISYGVDDEYKNKGIKGEYTLIANYDFLENKNQPHSGSFKGVLKSAFYSDKNSKIHYDNIDMNSDSYTNNEFVGQWIAYNDHTTKRCNWGDFRVPNSGDLDIGAGEFSPNAKYLKIGWLSVPEVKWWK